MHTWMRYLSSADAGIINLIDSGASLEEILNSEDILCSVRAQTTKLIDYLTLPEVSLQLLHYMVDEAKNAKDDNERYKYPYLASEILAEDQASLRKALMSQQCLDLIFSFLEREEPIQPLYAHHVCRVFHNLLCQFGTTLIEMMDERNSVEKFVRHLECFPFCELLYDIIVIVETERDKVGLIEWMKKFNLVYLLLKAMKESRHPLIPSNTGQILNNIIGRFAPTNREELFNDIFADREAELLVSMATSPGSVSIEAFTSAVSLLIDIVWNTRVALNEEKMVPVQADVAPPAFVQKYVLGNFEKFVDTLRYDWTTDEKKGAVKESLKKEEEAKERKEGEEKEEKEEKEKEKKEEECCAKSSSDSSSSGEDELSRLVKKSSYLRGRSVGNYRIKVIILLSTLVRSGYGRAVDDAFITSSAMTEIVDLFFEHPNNTILHSEVYTLLEQCILVRGAELRHHVAVESPLTAQVVKMLRCEDERLKKKAELADSQAKEKERKERKREEKRKKKEEERRNRRKERKLAKEKKNEENKAKGEGEGENSERSVDPSNNTTTTSDSASESEALSEEEGEEGEEAEEEDSDDEDDFRFAKRPVVRVMPAPCHMAHVLHFARVLEEHRFEIDGLDERLTKEGDWEVLYENIVTPQMKRQEPELNEELDELGGVDDGDLMGQGGGYGLLSSEEKGNGMDWILAGDGDEGDMEGELGADDEEEREQMGANERAEEGGAGYGGEEEFESVYSHQHHITQHEEDGEYNEIVGKEQNSKDFKDFKDYKEEEEEMVAAGSFAESQPSSSSSSSATATAASTTEETEPKNEEAKKEESNLKENSTSSATPKDESDTQESKDTHRPAALTLPSQFLSSSGSPISPRHLLAQSHSHSPVSPSETSLSAMTVLDIGGGKEGDKILLGSPSDIVVDEIDEREKEEKGEKEKEVPGDS
ncbi:putative serine/threonine-protein phosphatase 6 regulatory subunit 3 [Monocercomonoides exilis]|uniref:putative serine/threonine-protein phosphatase 6 regulatory subunit 3 n=1 Tax=Monocercomonoides exilis TaxID=2049356 RepID=UPI003559E9F8|nr:putative serine/threonine-protein phosphatase 6 regulatory subunit 3 [Monocercomonoides exilis]